jgi:c-di-GMP-binding flagellar brake protein YcgR
MINTSLALGDKVELSRLKFNTDKTYNNETVYISLIQDIKEDSLIISAPVENGKIIPLEIGTAYLLSIYSKGGLYKCRAVVSNRYKKNNLHFVDLEIKSPMRKHQRRQFYRLECALTFHFSNEEIETYYKGIIIDISGGGLRFTSKEQIQVGSIINCTLDINSVETKKLELKGKVILSQLVDYQVIKYETRIMFQDISNEDREAIIKFIFDEQRKRRKRRKGL